MASALRLYRATVVSGDDPQGLGRVRLGIVRKIPGSPVPEEGWADIGVAPLGGGIELRPTYATGDTVLYAAERLPFVGAVLLCRQSSAGGAAGSPGGLPPIALGPGNELIIRAAAVTVESATVKFAGTVQCDTVIANNVVAVSYTPGAGNIW